MSKKFVTILIFVLLCLCLAFSACGENPDTDKADGDNGNTEQGGGNTGDNGSDESEEITEMYVYVNDNKLKVTLAKNSSVDALIEILKNGDITYIAHANNFEIYGDIGQDLTTKNDTHLTSQVGDVFLWAGDNICIFFGNNSYSYTRIGKIEGYSAAQLKEILAPSSTVQVTLSLK